MSGPSAALMRSKTGHSATTATPPERASCAFAWRNFFEGIAADRFKTGQPTN